MPSKSDLEFQKFDAEGNVKVSLGGQTATNTENERARGREEGKELLTYDTNLAKLLGNEILLNLKRLMVENTFAEIISERVVAVVQGSCIIDCTGMSEVVLQLAGTWAGTVTFEVTADDKNWLGIYGITTVTTGIPILTTTASGIFKFNVSGFKRFRARCSAYTSGVIAMYARATASPVPLAHQGFVYDPATIVLNTVFGSTVVSQALTTAITAALFALRVLPVGSNQVLLQQQPKRDSPTAGVLSTRDGIPGGGELAVVNKDPIPMSDQLGEVALRNRRLAEELALQTMLGLNQDLQTADASYGSCVDVGREFIEIR